MFCSHVWMYTVPLPSSVVMGRLDCSSRVCGVWHRMDRSNREPYLWRISDWYQRYCNSIWSGHMLYIVLGHMLHIALGHMQHIALGHMQHIALGHMLYSALFRKSLMAVLLRCSWARFASLQPTTPPASASSWDSQLAWQSWMHIAG